MKKLLSTVAIIAAACLPFSTHATTITFESGLDPFFSYSEVGVSSLLFPSDSGYRRMQNYTGSLGFAYNPAEASPSFFMRVTSFDLDSFLICGAWGRQTLTINGILDDNLIYTREILVDPNPQLVTLNWVGIERFTISIGNDFVPDPELGPIGQQWVLDNIIVNGSDAEVPEPGTIALLGLGLLGFAIPRRKSAN